MDVPTPTPDQTLGGIKIAVIVFSAAGSAVAVLLTPEMTRRQAITAFLIGVFVAVATTPLVLYKLGWPDSVERAVCFVLALVAMRLIPALFTLVGRLKDLKIPNFLDKE